MTERDGTRVLAVVPARGGSKGVPGKNLAKVGEDPLVARAVRALRSSARVDEVVVSTDSTEIGTVAKAAGAVVLPRPAELSGDSVSSEAVLLHVLDAFEQEHGHAPDVVLMVQCTSPFIATETIDNVVAQVADNGWDCALTAVRVHEFLWQRDAEGGAVAVNHDAAVRPRRQERAPEFRETGAVYGMRVSGFRAARHRFFGRIGLVETPAEHAIEIDTPEDLAVARLLAATLEPPVPELVDVDAVVTDFDGVHTDDHALVLQDGTEGVMVSRSDGAGVARLLAAGVPLLILSVEQNPVVAARAAKLGAQVLHGVGDKAAVLKTWLAEQRLDPARVAYVGNDLRDLEAMALVGWPIAVQDARPEVRRAARLVLDRPGGYGAVREVADLVLHAVERRKEQ
ncbi:N-acylneuraminate cytidylyltransferase [Amycolatopsis bartoniae]|uniref:acylneuraminate cytidylyltransferase n=1 Tax=Amycolatopsis bartoniae TaxID=941986 RepID=UPI00184FAB22|nr:acylneuraminate cytidylyltransferase [Amycolatopsis bartoniae]MBB2933417.1 N-acylneuraminate cytidylyltransferase [Amycolatopsis bartoniae]